MIVPGHQHQSSADPVAEGIERLLIATMPAEQDFPGPFLDDRLPVRRDHHACLHRAGLAAAQRDNRPLNGANYPRTFLAEWHRVGWPILRGFIARGMGWLLLFDRGIAETPAVDGGVGVKPNSYLAKRTQFRC